MELLLIDATATRHARGAWPRFDGADMTHSADGTAQVIGAPFDFSFAVSRYYNRDAATGKRADYTVTLYRKGGRRELTAESWDGIKGEILRAFKRQIESMADDSTPRGVAFVHPVQPEAAAPIALRQTRGPDGESILVKAAAPVGIVIPAGQARDGESGPWMWDELTEGGKREARERGFYAPHGRAANYFTRKGYRDGELMLSRYSLRPQRITNG